MIPPHPLRDQVKAAARKPMTQIEGSPSLERQDLPQADLGRRFIN
jgi:hypothetical protein